MKEDGEGDIWLHLNELIKSYPDLLPTDRIKAEKNVQQALRLGNERRRFPYRRLIQLWKNKRWNEKVTGWYKESFAGREMFRISICCDISSLRIDTVCYPKLHGIKTNF
jgi:hypothetical protein